MRHFAFVFASLFVFLFVATACSGDGSSGTDGPDGDEPPAGYVRYRTTPIMLMPGESGLWAQWVSAPMDRDLDVEDVIGWQSQGGHHALLYTTSDVQPAGTTRPWADADQLSSRFVGGVGGEGAAAVKLPAGAVFRIKAGGGLLIQTHYVNTSDAAILGEAYLDVKLVEAAPGAQVASLFSSTTLAIDVPPGESSLQVDCVLPEDVKLLMFANHMHERGMSTTTTLVDADGMEHDLKRDDAWEYEFAFNPNFTTAALASPIVLPAGSKLRTTCNWLNEGVTNINFPDEMCVFFGLYLSDHDQNCVDGVWQ